MDAAAFWIAAALNIAFAIGLILRNRRRVAGRGTTRDAAGIAFGLQYAVLGLPATVALFCLLIRWLDTDIWHGELLLGGLIGLVVLTVVLSVIGGILIKWQPMKW
jgi:hypothetical protein